MAQRLVGHHRAEVRAADADVDDVHDRLAGVTLPLSGADPLAKDGHPTQHRVNLPHDVHPVNQQRGAPRHTQGHVQDGAILGDVDALAGEHRRRALGKARLLGQLDEQTDRLLGYAILRVIQVEAWALGREALSPSRVHGEQIAQRGVRDLALVGSQLTPGGPLGQGDDWIWGRAHVVVAPP